MRSVSDLYSFWCKLTLSFIKSRDVLFWFFEFKGSCVVRGVRRKCYRDEVFRGCSSAFANNTVCASLAAVTDLLHEAAVRDTAVTAAFCGFKRHNKTFCSIVKHTLRAAFHRAENTRLSGGTFFARQGFTQKDTLSACC